MNNQLELRVQYPFPFEDKKQFEEFIEDYFNALDETRSYSLFGRDGQQQYGIDIISKEKKTVIQCKLKSLSRNKSEVLKELLKDLHSDFTSFLEYNKSLNNAFTKFYLTSSFPDDKNVQTEILKLNTDIVVEYWGWGRLMRQIPESVKQKYYPLFNKKVLEYYSLVNPENNLELEFSGATHDSEIHESEITFSEFGKESEFQTKLKMIDQIEKFLSHIYDQLEFVPIQFLIKRFPFQDQPFSRYSDFVLSSTNKDLGQFLNAFEILNQSTISIIDQEYFSGCSELEQRIQAITQKLTNNLIYYVRTPIQSDWKDVRFFNNDACNCARCQIEKFSFQTIDFKLEVKDSKIENLMNQAYAHFKMGHFKNAYSLYKNAEDEALKYKREFTLFLIRYNLIHLATFLEHNYYDDPESKKIAEEIRSIDLSKSLCSTKNGFHFEIQQWMMNDHYMLHFQTKIGEIKQQLIDHYQNTINGGSGSNNYVNDLINQYAQLHQFLQQNTIINDCYKPYLDIVEMVIEGLFASYAVEGDRSSRINSFNDWTLTQMIKYGRTPSLRRLINRYKIRELHYENHNQDHESVKELIIRLFNQFEIAVEMVQSYDEPNNDHFSNDYNRWLNNALYIVAHVDFDEAFIRRFTDTFISYYKRKTHRLASAEIGSFLICKFHLFTQSQRKELLLLGMNEEQLIRSYFLHNFAELAIEQKLDFKLSKSDILTVLQRPFDESSNVIALIHVYRCLSEKSQRTLIQKRIIEELALSFRLDIWNSAVLYDVIPCNDEDLDKAIEVLTPKKNLIGRPGNPFGGARYSGGLDQFINVCYDKGIDFSASKFDGLRDNSNYYQWLLNVDGFNYELFDSEWLMEYGTKPYLKRFSESEVLKKHIESLLSKPEEKNKEILKKTYMDIYIIKGWERLK